MKKAAVQLITLGCPKNRVDSEFLLRQIFANGFEIVPEDAGFASSPAKTVIINTCGFIKDAKEESIETIFDVVASKRAGYTEKIYVFGCLSQRYGSELRELIPEVDRFFGVFDSKSLLREIGGEWDDRLDRSRLITTPGHYAYLKISEGCNQMCSYCAIPMIRGGHHSVPLENLVVEAEMLASSGVKELIVVAQDTTYYGVDLYGERKIANLLERLAMVEEIEWIRLLYSYPFAFPENLLGVLADNPKVCKYLDIPLQHINDKVLANMRRSINGASTRRLVDRIRQRVPGIVLRTTMIVGHPGEDEQAFEELLAFVEEAKFERLGAFAYSEEEGTWGASNLSDSIPEEIKEERLGRLMDLQRGVSLNYNISRTGSCDKVLIDSRSEDFLIGRSAKETPEVDGEILIDCRAGAKNIDFDRLVGTFVEVKVTGADEYDLTGEILRVEQ